MEDLNEGRDILCSSTGRFNLYKLSILPNWSRDSMQVNQNSSRIFFFLVEIDNLVLKFIWKSKKPNRARVILTKRAKLEESYYVISELIKIYKYSVVLT